MRLSGLNASLRDAFVIPSKNNFLNAFPGRENFILCHETHSHCIRIHQQSYTPTQRLLKSVSIIYYDDTHLDYVSSVSLLKRNILLIIKFISACVTTEKSFPLSSMGMNDENEILDVKSEELKREKRN